MFMASRTAGPWRILVALLSALLAAWASPVAIGAAADSSAAAAYAYTYDVLRGVQVASPATVRGPPSASDQDTLYDVVGARSRGASVRAGAASDSPVRKRAWVPVASARGAGFTATTLEHVRGVGGALASIGKSAVAANTTARGWKVGDPIENLTKAGNSPAWSTVRARYRKNAAGDALEGEYSASNLARMQAGKPPLHDELGVPMELNHIIPRSHGGGRTLDNLEPLWPWEHAAVDPCRFYTGPTP